MASTNSEAVNHRVPKVTWLDCTLRDGGYYNEWDFPLSIVQDYLYAMADCAVDRVEVGFRSLEVNQYKGFAAYVPDSILTSLDVPGCLSLGVMINTSEIAAGKLEIESHLSQLLPNKSKEKFSLVRLATHFEELEVALTAAKWLKAEGFEVGLNVMQVSEAPIEHLMETVSSLDERLVDVLYFADSLGSLGPDDVTTMFTSVKDVWRNPLGFHAHDNRGVALANSLAALDAGAEWVDSTISGMGRGAGNTQSELLVGHLEALREVSANTRRLDELISQYFLPLKEKCGWGVNSYYVRAAVSGIHPTFIQELLSNTAYSPLEIDAAIDVLSNAGARRFSKERLNQATSFVELVESPKGYWNQAELFDGRRVLLVGGGSMVSEHSEALSKLAETDDVFVLAANLSEGIPSDLIDAHIACHPLRIISDAERYPTIGKPLIAPQELLPPDTQNALARNGSLLNLGLKVSPSSMMHAEAGLIVLPKAQVLAFSLLACLSGGASEVMLAGFDGYGPVDSRRAEEQRLINDVLGLKFEGKVSAITPTQYTLPMSSVYGILR